jgi:hypothetical protein
MVKLSEMQVLILWALLGKGGESQAKLKPQVKKTDREALLRAGMITAEKRGRGTWLEATDAGWAWAGENLGSALPERSPAGSAILREWLTRLDAFMRARDIGLADILGPQPAPAPAAGDHAILRERIRNAYLDVTGGIFNRRALLSNLRRRLPDVDRAMLDEALRRMQHDNEASLMRLDNPIDIAESDREAAVQIGSEPRHILWISR